jgi:copper resistance protein C
MRARLWCAAVASLALAMASGAHAHAILVSSQPAANAEVAGKDVDVRLEFNSRIDAARSSLQLAKDGGALEPLALAESKEPNLLTAKAAGLAPGAYRLRWQVLSVDGHVSRGDVNFKVRAP